MSSLSHCQGFLPNPVDSINVPTPFPLPLSNSLCLFQAPLFWLVMISTNCPLLKSTRQNCKISLMDEG